MDSRLDKRYIVRLIKSQLFHFKNVAFGEIKYMNCSSVEKNAEITQNDIVGIYGQNGSGKTAMVEALDIVRCILCGETISYDAYAGILDENGNSKIAAYFFMEHGDNKYKIKYEVTLQPEHEEKKINLLLEQLTFWRRGSTWKSERSLSFCNPYYDSGSILEKKVIRMESNHMKYFKNVDFIKSLQNLAVYCAQRRNSIFFNPLVLKNCSFAAEEENEEGNKEEIILFEIIRGLFQFGHSYFQVVKVSQLGAINENHILPVNIHSEAEGAVVKGCLPLVMNGYGEIPETVFREMEAAIHAINTALKAIIPNLRIELVPIREEMNKDGIKIIKTEAYSIRDGHRFLTRYESEGIKRIISLLSYLISLYNYPEICLVVDELDSGIFEYLLGELLGVLNAEAKGQLIFTSHNFRAFEKLDTKNIICSTTNPQNRYIRLTGVEKKHNPRDFYIRTILLGGQKEELYDEMDLQSLGYSFRQACHNNEDIKIQFSERFREKLDTRKL